MYYERNYIMAVNEGVGKKIVEALKKQSNGVELTQELSEIQQNDISENLDFEDSDFSTVDPSAVSELYSDPVLVQPTEEEEVNEETFEIKEQPVYEEPVQIQGFQQENINNFEPNIASMPQQPKGWNFNQPQNFNISYEQPQVHNEAISAKQFEMPPNVAVLKRLIAQLPTGVTKQTGAQIIKQTMEALGISMNTVLHEAQKVQDDMNESIKNCMMSIQEYKNNIRNLEKQGLDYQRQVNQLNDLISLFILSDKD